MGIERVIGDITCVRARSVDRLNVPNGIESIEGCEVLVFGGGDRSTIEIERVGGSLGARLERVVVVRIVVKRLDASSAGADRRHRGL